MNKLKTEELSIPNFGPSIKLLPEDYAVKYFKANLDSVEQVAELELIETRALASPDETVLIDKDKFTFMDKYFVVLKYLVKKVK